MSTFLLACWLALGAVAPSVGGVPAAAIESGAGAASARPSLTPVTRQCRVKCDDNGDNCHDVCR